MCNMIRYIFSREGEVHVSKPYWEGKHFSFFQNKKCEYFPCHQGVDKEKFNCLFCYCPLYVWGVECGGNPAYTESGIKDCTDCTLPHDPENYGYIIGQSIRIQEAMTKRKDSK